jgi:hypothetical protein
MVPEKTIDDFVRHARDAAEANLESIILYGSAATGEFDPEFSNLNMFCVLRDTSLTALQALQPLVKWWDGQKQPPPLLMTRAEFAASADVFSIEYMDMQQSHRVLFGDDVLVGVQISPSLHRNQVEYELREKLILLRQHVTLAAGNEKRLQDLLLRSVPSIVTLFRHALIALGNRSPMGKREAIQTLAGRLGFDPSAIYQVLDVREHKSAGRKLDVNALLANYLVAVEKVIAAVDQAS